MLPTLQLASLLLCLLVVSQCSARPVAPRIERAVERIDPEKADKDEDHAKQEKQEVEKGEYFVAAKKR